jgi:hypothetical protein
MRLLGEVVKDLYSRAFGRAGLKVPIRRPG